MKSFIVICVLIVSSECGLLDDLVTSKDQKSKTGKEPNQGTLLKVRQNLENGTKIVIDALGNIIRIPPKENNEKPNSEGTPESPTKDNEIVKDDEASKPSDKNKTLPTESNAKTKDAVNNMVNTTDTSKTNGNTGKNCTSADGKPCGNVVPVNRAFLKVDECATGKDRADDGTCVEEL